MPATSIDRFEIRLSGLGGQGILTLGRILGQALALEHGYHVAQTQSYGPEARGGASRADVVVSSRPISYPKPVNLDLLVALSQEACNLYYRDLKAEGLLLVDADMVPQPPTNRFCALPFTALAREKLGNAQAMNIVCLGALVHVLPMLSLKAVKATLPAVLPPKIVELNLKAVELGHARAKKQYPDIAKQWTFSSPTTTASMP
ncbi:pyruvate ferredoxin oxidoreductase subunit gamma [Thermodesulfomicrobium sp. WS]|uniref:2-oxoacid:acceptor oxidoreductase family protein n=1 Tax=Thermodesulfomicrobium sp. WS TaxID=3004129 RepID=UPI002490A280|nr:2-oxoacid:acceptor oxidoreductase family protein [Thermodesulfomicrobium sp. WS]BDV00621.1 pyruvate ferredoxin oxidoreductase subunit gamma [Thermodesulfomicrobium sp. WS]